MSLKTAPSLRKACHACTKSKRRCIPQLPACERCAKKQISCVYDLEPVIQTRDSTTYEGDSTANSASEGPLNIVYNSVGTARDACISAFARGEGADSAATRPMLTAEGESVQWLLATFSQIARDGLERVNSPFIHPHILQHAKTCVCQRDDVSSREVQTRLIEIHDLITLALQRVLLEKPSKKEDVELDRLIVRMFSTTHSLWSAAPRQLSDTLNSWEAWFTAESIRRSMFAAIIVKGLWQIATSGYIFYEPFFESIPFDTRKGLWEASTATEWQQAINQYGGEHTKLKSYHEFITMSGPQLSREEDGAFQRILYICYYGTSGMRAVEAMDKAGGQKTNQA